MPTDVALAALIDATFPRGLREAALLWTPQGVINVAPFASSATRQQAGFRLDQNTSASHWTSECRRGAAWISYNSNIFAFYDDANVNSSSDLSSLSAINNSSDEIMIAFSAKEDEYRSQLEQATKNQEEIQKRKSFA